MRVPLDIATGFYQSQSLPFSSQRCINWIPTIPEAAALDRGALFGSPGISLFATLSGVGRGGILAKGVPYFVNGGALYSISVSGVATNLGVVSGLGMTSLATNTTVDSNTKIVIVVDSGDGFVYDSSLGPVTQITDPDYQLSSTVSFKAAYFTFTTKDGLQIFNSALNDPTSFDALDTGTAEIDPDLVVTQIMNHNEWFVMGEETGELFQNVGGTGFPFQRIQGANIQKGGFSKFGIVSFDNSFAFVGGGKNELPAIWKVAGSSSAAKISTSAIDTEIQKYTREEISNCFAMTYQKNGQFFAIFTFESTTIASKTFAYNATSSALAGRHNWHELQSGISDNRWRVQSIVKAYGKLLVQDQSTGKIGYLNDNVFDEYGETIKREKTTQPFRQVDEAQFWDHLEVRMESGVGLASGQGSNPTIRMKFSDDGARTFSSEFSRSFGKVGEYTKRTVWRRQGRVPMDRVLTLTCTDPVKCNLLSAHVNDEIGQ